MFHLGHHEGCSLGDRITDSTEKLTSLWSPASGSLSYLLCHAGPMAQSSRPVPAPAPPAHVGPRSRLAPVFLVSRNAPHRLRLKVHPHVHRLQNQYHSLRAGRLPETWVPEHPSGPQPQDGPHRLQSRSIPRNQAQHSIPPRLADSGSCPILHQIILGHLGARIAITDSDVRPAPGDPGSRHTPAGTGTRSALVDLGSRPIWWERKLNGNGVEMVILVEIRTEINKWDPDKLRRFAQQRKQ